MFLGRGDNGPVVMPVADHARHLFDGFTVVAWAYAFDPHRVLWAARSDGKLLSFTWVRGLNVMAWAIHTLGGGETVEDLITIPEGTEDAVYMAVHHNGGDRRVMRLAYATLPLAEAEDGELVPDVRYAVHLDQCTTYNGLQTTRTLVIVTPADIAVGDTVLVEVSSGTLRSDEIDTDGDVVKFDDPDGGEPWRFRIITHFAGLQYTAQLLNRAMTEAQCPTSGEWWLCRHSVSDVAADTGETVTALADGNEIPGLVVSTSGVKICEVEDYANYAGIIHVGLPYNGDVESLDARPKDARQRLLKKVVVEFEHTRGGHVGPDFDHLVEIRNREVDHGYLTIPLRRNEEVEPVVDEWGVGGRVALRQSSPFPMTILGILRDSVSGGDGSGG